MERRSIEDWFAVQEGTVAVWQLVADGHRRGAIRHATRGMREVHNGVYLSGHAPPTDEQRWRAAALTAPRTVVSGESALAVHGIRDTDWGRTSVVRHGSGGARRVGKPGRAGGLEPFTLRRSMRLDGDVGWVGSTPVTSVERTILDRLARLNQDRSARLVRDALRLKKTNAAGLRMIAARHPGCRGVATLRALTDEYAPLPLHRTRSDAEGLALAILQAAGIEAPEVNYRIGGEEGDLVWLKWRRILELDGPSYHQFPSEDAKKQRIWEAAGFRVDRLPTDDVYDDPAKLLALAPPPPALNVPWR